MNKLTFCSTVLAACLLAAACSPGVQADRAQPAPAGAASTAPDFKGIDRWINSAPQRLQDLRGKVVLVEFWTYSCINCVRVLPHIKRWHAKYNDQGLVVIGVHTPEYGYERKPGNVQAAVRRFGITYPVAQDNGYETWNAYGNRYWPATYLIDQQGRIVYRHFGEGQYQATESRIRGLLGLDTPDR